MPVAASAGSMPRLERMRTAPAWMLMPTPSGLSSLTWSNISTSKPARFRHIAAVRPPMPAPAMTIFMLVSGIPAQAFEQQRRLVSSPALGLRVAELVQVRPAVDAAVVPVVEDDADGVVADRLDIDDLHVAPARHQLLGRRRAVALDLGRRTLDAQVLGRQEKLLAVGEVDLDARAFLEDAQLVRPRRGRGLVAALVGRGLGETVAHGLPPRCRASLTSMIGMPSRIG